MASTAIKASPPQQMIRRATVLIWCLPSGAPRSAARGNGWPNISHAAGTPAGEHRPGAGTCERIFRGCACALHTQVGRRCADRSPHRRVGGHIGRNARPAAGLAPCGSAAHQGRSVACPWLHVRGQETRFRPDRASAGASGNRAVTAPGGGPGHEEIRLCEPCRGPPSK
jgi:hypothetical protein